MSRSSSVYKSCHEDAIWHLQRFMGGAPSLHAGDAVTVWYNGLPVRGTVTSATLFVQVRLRDQRGEYRSVLVRLTPLDCWLHGWYADSDYATAKRTAPLTTAIEWLRRGPHHNSGALTGLLSTSLQSSGADSSGALHFSWLLAQRGLLRAQEHLLASEVPLFSTLPLPTRRAWRTTAAFDLGHSSGAPPAIGSRVDVDVRLYALTGSELPSTTCHKSPRLAIVASA